MPIAAIGLAAYLVILLLLQTARRPWARVALFAVAGAGTVISAGLLLYSALVIQATCVWCIASGVAMTLLFLLSIPMLRRGDANRPCRPAVTFALLTLTLAALGVQAGYMQRAANAPPIAAQRLAGVAAADLIDAGKSLGPADAPVTIVVFADLWCPACRAAHGSLVNYQRDNPDVVRLVYRHLPLWQRSGAAAALAEIAAERGMFWQFVAQMHQNPAAFNRDGWLGIMNNLGFDPDETERRVADAEDPAIARLNRDIALAEQLGITATPTFIVLVDGQSPISASQRTLPGILNAPAVLERLADASRQQEAALRDPR